MRWTAWLLICCSISRAPDALGQEAPPPEPPDPRAPAVPPEAPSPRAPDRPLGGAIEVTPGATCLSEKPLEAQVAGWLGREKVPPNIRVFVRGDADNPRAVTFRIAKDGKIMERRFDPAPAGCEEMHAAVALSIALSIDVNVLKRFLDPEVVHPPRFLASAEIGAGFSVVPGFSGSATLGLEYLPLPWLSGRAELFGHYSRDNTVVGSQGRFDATLGALGLFACGGGALVEDVRLELCAGVGGGLIHTRGQGYTVSHQDTGVWLSALSGIRLEAMLGIPWVLDVSVVSPIRVPSVRVERPNGDDRYRDATAGLLLSVGPAFRF